MKKVLFLSFVLTSTNSFAEQVPNPVVEAIQRDIIAWMKKNGWSQKSAKNKHIDLSHSGSSLNHNHHNHYGNNSASYGVISNDVNNLKHKDQSIQSSAKHSMSSILSQHPKPPKLNTFDDVSDAESLVGNTTELRELQEKHKKELAEYQKHIQQLEQNIKQHNETLNELSEKHEKQLQNNEKKIQEYEKKLKCCEEIHTKQNNHIETMKDSINELKQTIQYLEQSDKEKNSTIEDYAQKQHTLQKKLDDTTYQTEEFVDECAKTIEDWQKKPCDDDCVPLLTTPVIINDPKAITQWIRAACEELTKQHDYLEKFTLALKKVASEDDVKEAMKHVATQYINDQQALQARYTEYFEKTTKELKDKNKQLVEAEQKNKQLEDENNILRNQIAELTQNKNNYLAEYTKNIQNLQQQIKNLQNN